jgi:hypothetical protein
MAATPGAGPGSFIPPLNLSSGPAVSEAVSGGTKSSFGAFSFKPDPRPGIISQALPLVAIAGVAWLLMRR